MAAHGFARDMEFELLSRTEDTVWYGLKDTEETYGKYPFHFRLETGHRLEGNCIHVMWKVVNTGDVPHVFLCWEAIRRLKSWREDPSMILPLDFSPEG